MHSFKLARGSTIVALLLVGLTACGDSLTAPAPPTLDNAEPLLAKGSSQPKKYKARTIKIRPGRAVKEKFGDHELTMPANAVCDPATSGYGQALWDAPCTPLNKEIEVTAEWAEYQGNAVIRFKPDLRFVPAGNDKSRWVVLTLKHATALDPQETYTILWRDPVSGKWIDESVDDASTATKRKPKKQSVARRLKHFSDYFLWFGFGSYNVTSGIGLGGDMWGSW